MPAPRVITIGIAALCFYLFIVHMLTARRPFIPPAVFRDRNFSSGLLMMFAAGTVLVVHE